jgi:hypothetical protein
MEGRGGGEAQGVADQKKPVELIDLFGRKSRPEKGRSSNWMAVSQVASFGTHMFRIDTAKGKFKNNDKNSCLT